MVESVKARHAYSQNRKPYNPPSAKALALLLVDKRIDDGFLSRIDIHRWQHVTPNVY